MQRRLNYFHCIVIEEDETRVAARIRDWISPVQAHRARSSTIGQRTSVYTACEILREAAGRVLKLDLWGGLSCVGSYSDSDKPFLLRKCNISPGTEGTEPDFLTHHLSGLREQSSVFHKEKCRLKTSGDGLVGMRVATSHKWRRTQRQLQRGKHAVYEVWKKHMAFARISFGVSPPPTIHDFSRVVLRTRRVSAVRVVGLSAMPSRIVSAALVVGPWPKFTRLLAASILVNPNSSLVCPSLF